MLRGAVLSGRRGHNRGTGVGECDRVIMCLSDDCPSGVLPGVGRQMRGDEAARNQAWLLCLRAADPG